MGAKETREANRHAAMLGDSMGVREAPGDILESEAEVVTEVGAVFGDGVGVGVAITGLGDATKGLEVLAGAEGVGDGLTDAGVTVGDVGVEPGDTEGIEPGEAGVLLGDRAGLGDAVTGEGVAAGVDRGGEGREDVGEV